MPIESATYISQLNAANPPSTDPVGEAANHLRLIKAVLKNTFPQGSGAYSGGFVPTGGIIMWSGTIVSIPSGWGLCDGSVYAKADGSGNITSPDLRDKFIIGAGGARSPGTTGGNASVTPTITVGSTALTVANLPAHNHSVTDPGHNHTATQEQHRHNLSNGISFHTSLTPGGGLVSYYNASNSLFTAYEQPVITVQSKVTGITIGNTGSGTGHNHTATSSAVSIEPVNYALAFIMRL